jgi:opacity protein-like surface antigen
MKAMKTIMFTLVALVAFNASQAQKGETTLGVNYSVGIPTGDFKNVVGKESYRGWGVDIMHGVNNKLQLGVAVGFQDFYQKNDRQVYHTGDGQDISAVLTHSIQTIPILAKAKYALTENGAIRPYVALGAGGNLVMFREMLGEFGETESYFKFAVKPEIGVQVPIRRGTAFHVSAAYNYLPFNKYDISNFNNVSVSAGLSVPLRK